MDTDKRNAIGSTDPDDYYRHHFEQSPDGILIVDRDSGRITDVNPALLAMLGYSRKDLLEKILWELVPFKDVVASKAAFEQVLDQGGSRSKKYSLGTCTGSPVDVEVASNTYEVDRRKMVQWNVRDISGRTQAEGTICESERKPDRVPQTGIASFRDISKQGKREKELSQLNRILIALSKSNQAMIHAKDEAGYMNEVCQIVVKDCGHAMVWIGMAEDDEEKTVRPAAYAGFEKGYLDTLKITWSDTERGHGPTGTAIRTGKVCMCKNMLTDPNFRPWRAEAVKRGYASSAVFPLAVGGKPFGAITIYSREADAFPDDEVRLLTELASDLAYGINMFGLQAARAQAEEALAKNEVRYRALFENAPLGIGMATLDGRNLATNEAMHQLLGYTQDEISKINLRDIYRNPVERDRIVRQLQTNGRVINEKVELNRKDGTSVPVHLTAAKFPWESGEALLAIVEDITERERLEEVRNWLASFPERNPSPVVEVDLSGNVYYINPAARILFPDLEVRKKEHPWLDGLEPIFDSYIKGTRSSSTRDVEVGSATYQQTISFIAENQRVRIYAFDITDRVKAEKALRKVRDELEVRVQDRTQELEKTNEQLRVEIAERQRLAQNLHDAVNQSLFSAGLIAEVMPRLWDRDQAAARHSLEDLRHLVRGAQAEMRALLAELRPSVLTEADLGDLLHQLSNAFTGRVNVPVAVNIAGECVLPPDIQVTFYRLCQEGLTNIAKHAEATQVEIDLQREAEAVELHIRDNGRGFDAKQPPPGGHFGLTMMRERAEAAGIDLSILSRPTQGTEIIIRWKAEKVSGGKSG